MKTSCDLNFIYTTTFKGEIKEFNSLVIHWWAPGILGSSTTHFANDGHAMGLRAPVSGTRTVRFVPAHCAPYIHDDAPLSTS